MLKRSAILLLVIAWSCGACFAQSQTEANLKAVFMYNFTKFIEWENLNMDKRFVIGILGQSSLEKPLREIAKNNMVSNKKIEIRHYNSPEEIGQCHILFIPRSNVLELASILEKLDRGVLTISESPGFARQGTAINFVVLNDKLKFEMNKRAIYLAGLKASSQLLKLALIVDQ